MSKFSGLSVETEASARMTLNDPISHQPLRNLETGEEAWIELLPAASAVGRAHDRSVTDKQIKLRGQRMTAEQIEADFAEKLVKLTKGWSLVGRDGQPMDLPFNLQNVRLLYSEEPWVRDAVSEFVNYLGNFQTAASTNSSTSPNTSSD